MTNLAFDIAPEDGITGGSLRSPLIPPPPTRTEAVRAVIDLLGPADIIIPTSGELARDVVAAVRAERLRRREPLEGPNGIGLGLPFSQPKRCAVVLDDETSAHTHLKGLSAARRKGWPNVLHVVLDSDAENSAGGSALEQAARADGYRQSVRCSTDPELRFAVRKALREAGPTLVIAAVDHPPAVPPTGSEMDHPSATATAFRYWLYFDLPFVVLDAGEASAVLFEIAAIPKTG